LQSRWWPAKYFALWKVLAVFYLNRPLQNMLQTSCINILKSTWEGDPVSNLPNRFEVIQQLPSCETSTCICLSYKLLRCVIHTCLALAQVLADCFALHKGPNYSGFSFLFMTHKLAHTLKCYAVCTRALLLRRCSPTTLPCARARTTAAWQCTTTCTLCPSRMWTSLVVRATWDALSVGSARTVYTRRICTVNTCLCMANPSWVGWNCYLSVSLVCVVLEVVKAVFVFWS